MAALTLQLDVQPFSIQTLCETLRLASGAVRDRPNQQTVYLAAYLAHDACAAGTMLLEWPYVDRHYIEEYSRYYATALHAPAPHATRLHFFSQRIPKATLLLQLAKAAEGEAAYEEVRAELQDSYLGFSVIRPIPSAPIGRTVLRPYGNRLSRVLVTAYTHRVHICGIELQVNGVPFQQQEVAVGACATTAIWSSLAVAARATGRRPPTPFEVTDAATRHVLNDRPFPADSGLDLQQALAAIRTLGFAPHTLRPAKDPNSFSIAVKTYLRSGYPVVLLLHERGSGYHAVAAVGYRDPDVERKAESYVTTDGNRSLASSGMALVYVHEDRLGPYTRMQWIVRDGAAENDSIDADVAVSGLSRDRESGVWLQHEPYSGAKYTYPSDRMEVYAAIVPLYPKLRLSALSLLKASCDFVPVLKRWHEHLADVHIELRFQLSGDYLRELLTYPLEQATKASELCRTAVLPRYVGTARFLHNGEAFLDAVFDTTDVLRDEPSYSRLIALVALVDKYTTHVKEFIAREVPHSLAV